MQYTFPPRPLTTAKVQGSDQLFPVNRIHCVGRNYAEHTREMGFDPDREPPFFFQKPTDALVPNETDIPFPPSTNDLQHEIELVAAIGKSGRNISIEDALDYVWGYATGVDLTRRDLQLAARERGRPWEPGKAFDRSAPMTEIVPTSVCGHLKGASISLSVNGETRQSSTIDHLIWSVAEVVSILSESWDLIAGDLIFTGTPAGVGPIKAGDQIRGQIDGLPDIQFNIT